ncbi:zinc ribbon domain-containing protein [Desulfofalx alkaliphila]|uniref:zinc ribbon domain-containing protein n=1 Tax=Desulfofalx alkaliphila TaxID=105483 RepID=UPI000AB1B78E|nr:zinc ribbon domain-containing protein [Desulfofalx alkaliphila]
MEFFNRLGEKAKVIGERAKEATRKPTELVEVTRLKYEVSKLQKVTKNNIEAIGELVYRQFKGELNLEAEIERLLQATKNIEAEIVSLEQEIERLQPKPLVCPRCDIELPSGGIFCHRCGIKVAIDKEPEEQEKTEGAAEPVIEQEEIK